MRHKKKNKRLGRQSSHRKATLKSLALAVLSQQRIKTTKTKAKEARPLIDRLITISKENTPSRQRLAFSLVHDKELIKELFKEIGPRYKKRVGGYTRIIPLAFRRGDGADMAILELTEKKIVIKTKEKPKKEAVKDKKEAAKQPPKEEKTKEKMAPEPKAPPKPKVQVVEEVAKEKAKQEEKKIQKGFMKGLRRFFRSKNP